MPLMWTACGEEMFSDGIKFLAKNIKNYGVSVTFVDYEFMSHVWNVVMPSLPQSQHVTKLWAKGCVEVGAFTANKKKSEAWYVNLGNLETVQQDFDDLLDLPNDQVLKRMMDARDERAKFMWRGQAAAKL